MKIGQYLTKLCVDYVGLLFLAHPVMLYESAFRSVEQLARDSRIKHSAAGDFIPKPSTPAGYLLSLKWSGCVNSQRRGWRQSRRTGMVNGRCWLLRRDKMLLFAPAKCELSESTQLTEMVRCRLRGLPSCWSDH